MYMALMTGTGGGDEYDGDRSMADGLDGEEDFQPTPAATASAASHQPHLLFSPLATFFYFI